MLPDQLLCSHHFLSFRNWSLVSITWNHILNFTNNFGAFGAFALCTYWFNDVNLSTKTPNLLQDVKAKSKMLVQLSNLSCQLLVICRVGISLECRLARLHILQWRKPTQRCLAWSHFSWLITRLLFFHPVSSLSLGTLSCISFSFHFLIF